MVTIRGRNEEFDETEIAFKFAQSFRLLSFSTIGSRIVLILTVRVFPLLQRLSLGERRKKTSFQCQGSFVLTNPKHQITNTSLFTVSIYTTEGNKGTTVIGDNMVLQGGEKHCNSCGATTQTRSWGHVLWCRQVKRMTET